MSPMRLTVSLLLLLLPLCAQPPQEGGRKGGGGFAPKNLKILKPEEVRPAMSAYTRSLGVTCDFCHVMGGDRASDDNPKKNTARMMIAMVKDINAKFPDAATKTYVTCYTCHNGKSTPLTAPPAPTPGQ
jgi:hypothetical protein